MACEYSRSVLRVCVAQLCQNLGWNAIQSTPLELMTDLLERYLLQLGGTTHKYCEQFGRLDPNLDDLGLAFRYLEIPLAELEEYVRHIDPVPFAHDVVAFPAPKKNNFQFPNPKSREILHEREEHIPDYLPYMLPGMETEVTDAKSPLTIPEEIPSANSSEDKPSNVGEVSPVVTGEKRPGTSPVEGLPSKRMRLSSSNLPEEAGHSQYEMMSVTMSQTGHLTPTRGQGKLPDARTPPPGIRQHISVTADTRQKVVDRERPKFKDKCRLKPRTFTNLDESHLVFGSKEKLSDGSKSRLTTQVMKPTKKHGLLSKGKIVKLGKPLFKSKNSKTKGLHRSSVQELLFSDPLNMADYKSKNVKEKGKVVATESSHPELQRLMLSSEGGAGKLGMEKEAEKPPTALWDVPVGETSDDSDADLSGDDSLGPRLVIAEAGHKPRDTEVRKKERLQRIDDVLSSVLKNAMETQNEESSSIIDPVESSKDSTPSTSPVKAKVKDKVKSKPSSAKNTSSLDLDACINTVVRQSAEDNTSADNDTSGPAASQGEKKVKVKKKLKLKPGKGKSKGSGKGKDRLKVKLKSHGLSQDSSGLESESSIKPEKSYPPQFGVFDFQPDSPVPLAPLHPAPGPTQSTLPARQPSASASPARSTPAHHSTPAKIASPKKAPEPETIRVKVPPESTEVTDKIEPVEKQPTVQPLKIDINKEKTKHKERSKEKEHKKDRKDKKKDKEKKKKRDKDRDKSKDREKKEKHRDKKEQDDKGDGSMPLTVPKLKLKIGGISVGGTPSKSVTIATEEAIPKDASPSPDEIKAAPIRPEIPRLVIKPVPRRPVTDSPIKSPASPSASRPSPQRAPPPPGFKAIPESSPVSTKSEQLASPPRNLQAVSKKEESQKAPPVKSVSQPTPSMLPKFRPIPPVSSSPPPVRNDIAPPSPPKPLPRQRSPSPVRKPATPEPLKKKEPVPPPPKSPEPPSPSPPPSPEPRSPSPSPVPSPKKTEPEKPKSPEKPTTPEKAPSPKPEPRPIFYPAPPRRTASLSPRSREIPLYSSPPQPKRKNSSPRGRKPSSPARSATTPPKKRGPKGSPGRKKGSPKGPKRKPSLTASKADISSPPPSTFAREEEHPSFAPAKSKGSVSKDDSLSASESPPASPSPPSSPTPSKSDLPPPPPPSKPQPLQRAVFAETVGSSSETTAWEDTGQRIWICPTCKLPDDGSPMIGCDKCDEWYHWPCVNMVEPPPDDEDWFCTKCKLLQTKTKGRGKGAKRGRKKKHK